VDSPIQRVNYRGVIHVNGGTDQAEKRAQVRLFADLSYLNINRETDRGVSTSQWRHDSDAGVDLRSQSLQPADYWNLFSGHSRSVAPPLWPPARRGSAVRLRRWLGRPPALPGRQWHAAVATRPHAGHDRQPSP